MGLFRKKKYGKTAEEWFNLGRQAKDPEKKVEYYTKALEIDPKDAAAWYNKGLALHKLGRYEAAIDCYDMALKIDPKDAAAWGMKGIALGKLGKYYKDAIDCYDMALKIDPKDAAAWFGKGWALYKSGKYEAAIDCYDMALEIDPEYEQAKKGKEDAEEQIKAEKTKDLRPRLKEVQDKFVEQKTKLFEKLEQDTKKHGFAIQRTPSGIKTIPLKEGKEPLSQEEYETLSPKEKQRIIDRQAEVQELIKVAMQEITAVEEAREEEVRKLAKEKDLRSRLKEAQDKFVISQPLHAQIKLFKEGDHKIDIDTLKRLLDKVENTIPEIELSLKDKHFRLNRWGDLALEIRNNSIAHAFNLIPSFSDDIEVRRIKPITVKGKESITLEILARVKHAGRIPLDIKTQFEDAKGNKHGKLHEVWVEVSEDVKEEIRPAEFTPRATTPSTFPAELQPKYKDIKYLNKGGFARVFQAKRISDGKTVAVKVPLSLDEATGTSFLKEIKVWEELRHENIIELYDVNIMPIPYFEMEYAEKGDLEGSSKPVEAEEAARIILEILSGLKYAHDKGIIHRDLKPQNVLLTGDLMLTPKITDWGLSKVMAESKSSNITGFSPLYATPEQVAPKQFGRPDARSDIYQVGVIFYELVTGKLPFEGDSIIEISNAIVNEQPDLPSGINPEAKDVEEIILKCLNKRKEDRCQSAAELQKALAGYLKIQLTESLKKSRGDLTRSRQFCGDLVLHAAKQGDYLELLKHLSLLKDYAKEEEKAEIESLIKQISYRKEQGMEMNEEFLSGIKVLAYQVQMK